MAADTRPAAPSSAIGARAIAPATPTSAVGAPREVGIWAGLAVASLAIAGAFALLLATSRVPGIEHLVAWPVEFFRKGLVIHVVFSFVVWFLALFGGHAALAREAVGRASAADLLGPVALIGVVLAMPLLFVPAFLDRGEPTLNNYVPVIIDPLYYAGLAVMAVSISLSAIRLLLGVDTGRLLRDPIAATTAAAAVVVLVAVVCFALALRILEGVPLSHGFDETLMWGGGHVLQFVNTLMLLVAWQTLAGPRVSRLPTTAIAAATAWLLLGALVAPALYLVYPAFSASQVTAFTWLQYLLGPPAALVAIALMAGVGRPLPWREPGFLAFALSVLLFSVGGGLGLFVDGADTRTPAHYHGVIAAVTVAFFGVYFTRLLPLLGRDAGSPRRQRLILHVFAWGQLVACIGLFVAGGYGAPRKVAGDAQGLSDVAAMIGMGMNGLGGLVAVIGGVLFVWTVGTALLRGANDYRSSIGGGSAV